MKSLFVVVDRTNEIMQMYSGKYAWDSMKNARLGFMNHLQARTYSQYSWRDLDTIIAEGDIAEDKQGNLWILDEGLKLMFSKRRDIVDYYLSSGYRIAELKPDLIEVR